MDDPGNLEHRPDWLAAADVQDGDAASPSPKAEHGPWAWCAAVAVGGITGALLFVGYSAGRFAPGPWQGLLASSEPWTPPPFVSYWLAQALSPWLGVDGGSVTLLLGALGLACVAAALAWLAVHPLGPGPAHRAGGLASVFVATALALAFAAHPEVWRAYDTADPGLASAAFGLIGIALLCPLGGGTAGVLRLAGAGLFFGLATANETGFALLFVVALFAEVLFGGEDRRLESLGALLLGFLLSATWPLFQGLRAEASVAFFLSHALDSAYPMLQGYEWSTDALSALSGPWMLIGAAAAAGFLVLAAEGRHKVLFMLSLGVFLFGPLHPTFVQTGAADGAPPLAEGALILFLALMFAAAGLGLGALVARLGRPRVATALLGTACAVTVVLAAPAVSRSGDDVGALAEVLREGLPDDAVIVVRDPAILGYWETMRLREPALAGTVVLHRSDLSSWWGKRRLSRMTAENLAWRRMPLDPEDFARWKDDLPFYFQKVLQAAPAPAEKYFTGMLLWDFVQLNRGLRPVYLAGIEESWAAARARPDGVYLRLDAPIPGGDGAPFRHAAAPLHGLLDQPGVTSLVLGMSWAARLQGAPEEALALARLAAEGGRSPEAEAARIHAMARQGDLDAATAAAADYWRQWGAGPADRELEGAINLAANAYRAERELETGLGDDDGVFFTETADNLLLHLWSAQELRPLAAIFERASKRNPDDLNALYQLAAVQAQLGDFVRADETLQAWAVRGHFRFGDVQSQIAGDSRFRLFREARPDSHEAAETPAFLQPAT